MAKRDKDALTEEIEDLTRSLFEQANQMVADEARLRQGLECSNKKLAEGLRAALTRLNGRLRGQLKSYSLSDSKTLLISKADAGQ